MNKTVNLDTYITEVLRNLHLQPHLLGFHYAKEALYLMVEKPELGIGMDLYEAISDRYDRSNAVFIYNTLAATMNTLWANRIYGIENFKKYFGQDYLKFMKKPKPSELLKRLSARIAVEAYKQHMVLREETRKKALLKAEKEELNNRSLAVLAEFGLTGPVYSKALANEICDGVVRLLNVETGKAGMSGKVSLFYVDKERGKKVQGNSQWLVKKRMTAAFGLATTKYCHKNFRTDEAVGTRLVAELVNYFAALWRADKSCFKKQSEKEG